ncbi:MAG TPA: protoheme IX farnesyltransferase [Actinobacteria bacterium]|nr:protoheme IX farnesyltransferase [Actinomycetota bacterium]
MVSKVTPTSEQQAPGARLAVFVALMKPRIIELLLITTVPAMVIAADGWPGTWLVVNTLVGGILSAGGANAINNYVDRDIDELMERTAHRTLPRHQVEPDVALRFGVILGVAGFVWLWVTTNLLAAVISTLALLFYVFVYTMLLKRTTPQNIVIGGAAGAAPALVGWAAVEGSLALPAWILFALVFFWTPPHFWALSLKYKDDYARAGIPMLPVVAGVARTTRQIMIYTFIVVLISFALVPVADMRWLYLSVAAVLGMWFIVEAARVHLKPERAMKLFSFSNIYLAVVLASAWLDVALG